MASSAARGAPPGSRDTAGWARAQRHEIDQRAARLALRVYEIQHGRLDEPYLDRWAIELAVTDALTRLRAEAQPLE